MTKHTLERVAQILDDDREKTPEEISEILELPLHKINKAINQFKNREEDLA